MQDDLPVSGWHHVAHHSSDGAIIIAEARLFPGRRRGYRHADGRIFQFDSPESERLAWLACQLHNAPDIPPTVTCELDPFVIVGQLSGERREVWRLETFASALHQVCRSENEMVGTETRPCKGSGEAA